MSQLRCFQLYSPYGELNWLTPAKFASQAKLPAGSWGEYNLALCVSAEFRCFEETISLRSNLANKESMPNQELFPGWAFCVFRAISYYKSLELWGYRWICVESLDLWETISQTHRTTMPLSRTHAQWTLFMLYCKCGARPRDGLLQQARQIEHGPAFFEHTSLSIYRTYAKLHDCQKATPLSYSKGVMLWTL